ncbi:Fibrobacter succinogenes major paralogous domain [Candidatus Ornithobacterium hominis]|uniref:FISUMP domain-containing protein n=1 Tax=Candidatus Ornithobacterium hominis TaxID=2497989 RepID=UPI0024BC3A39|nr:FISUMP domain-containing protein [Candidatus Ornithobacterium hominis]CAI9429809.1 Fibrobacter succinogenes major paralogous domain [Candidatus Ornithobacterium hominis]
MKKLLLSFVVLPGALATAQVGINTDEPKAMLDISAKDDQKGDLRIEGVEEKSTQWLLVWDEEDQKVKRTSLSDLKWDIIIVDKEKINYIRDKQPGRAGEIINKIKQCTPQNIVFDKHFGDGKHDFVYCATTVSEGGYNRTWLNLNLGAAYADINNPDFDPTVNKVNKTGETIHRDKNLYGSLYQWQRASDGHEFRDSETTPKLADTWTDTGEAAGKFITIGNNNDFNWVENGKGASDSDLELWRAGRVNNPCPSGFHVPTLEEWQQLINAVRSNNQMYTQNKLPNLAVAGYRSYNRNGLLDEVGTEGHCWSSSVSNSNRAYHVSSLSGHITMNDSDRAIGLSVRCIKNN